MGRAVTPSQDHINENYSLRLNNTDTDLSSLSSAISKNKHKMTISLCLYGPSGTGKSAYARYLAEMMGMEILHIRASDLISTFVGETERKIATAFETARDQKQFLIFDEADSFLMNRQEARYSWEITAVNEMLTWMESHPHPFVCTTNLMNRIDIAALRRFAFKIKFDFLNKDQRIKAFKSFFGIDAPAGISQLDCLTPADFNLILNKSRLLNIHNDASMLLKMLNEENSAKNIQSNPIGFLG